MAADRLPTDITVERPGGRSLGVRLVGASAGPAVLYMHGSPSSRLDVDYLDDRSARCGIRLGGIDRPGYGRSTFERYDFASVAADAVAVADHLGAPRFAVVGQSSGVGYALAIAATYPDRVTAVATGGGGRPFEPARTRGASSQRTSTGACSSSGRTMRLRSLNDAQIGRTSASGKLLGELGVAQLRRVQERESMRQGQLGWARDNVVRMGPWDLDLGAIRCPTTIWLGAEDVVNVEGGAWLGERIPHATVKVLQDHGHYLIFELWDQVLDSLGLG